MDFFKLSNHSEWGGAPIYKMGTIYLLICCQNYESNNHGSSFSGPVTDTNGLYMDIKAYLDVIVPTLTQEKYICSECFI